MGVGLENGKALSTSERIFIVLFDLQNFYLQKFTSGFGRGSPLCTILRYSFWLTDPKNFLKAPSAPNYTNFEGGVRAKKAQFFSVKNFEKLLLEIILDYNRLNFLEKILDYNRL